MEELQRACAQLARQGIQAEQGADDDTGSLDREQLRSSLPLSLMLSKDGNYLATPATRAVLNKKEGPVLMLSSQPTGRQAKEHDRVALDEGTQTIYVGILRNSTAAGAPAGENAAQLMVNGKPAQLLVHSSEGDYIKELRVTSAACGIDQALPPADALAMLEQTFAQDWVPTPAPVTDVPLGATARGSGRD